MPSSMRPGQHTGQTAPPPGRGGQIMAGPPQGVGAPPGRMAPRPGPNAPPAGAPGRARGGVPPQPPVSSMASMSVSNQSTSSVSTSNVGSGSGTTPRTAGSGTQAGSGGGSSTADAASGSGNKPIMSKNRFSVANCLTFYYRSRTWIKCLCPWCSSQTSVVHLDDPTIASRIEERSRRDAIQMRHKFLQD